jgi:hypothetical protein
MRIDSQRDSVLKLTKDHMLTATANSIVTTARCTVSWHAVEPGNEFLQDLVDHFGKTQSQPNKTMVTGFYELISSNVGGIVG